MPRRWQPARRHASGDDLAAGERVRERAAVDVLEFAADRDAVGDASRADAAARDQLDRLFGLDLAQRWGWQSAARSTDAGGPAR